MARACLRRLPWVANRLKEIIVFHHHYVIGNFILKNLGLDIGHFCQIVEFVIINTFESELLAMVVGGEGEGGGGIIDKDNYTTIIMFVDGSQKVSYPLNFLIYRPCSQSNESLETAI